MGSDELAPKEKLNHAELWAVTQVAAQLAAARALVASMEGPGALVALSYMPERYHAAKGVVTALESEQIKIHEAAGLPTDGEVQILADGTIMGRPPRPWEQHVSPEAEVAITEGDPRGGNVNAPANPDRA